MKLAQGEYVALEKIENTYSACPIASQIYVHGNSLESYLLGVVVMEPTELANVASRVLGSKVSDEDKEGLQTIVRDPKVVDEVLHTLNQEAKSKGLKGCAAIVVHSNLGR
jgi:long-chain acyl-CoA synthetase